MKVKDLIEILQEQDPETLVGLGVDASQYVSHVDRVVLEDSTAVVPKDEETGEAVPLVVIYMSEQTYLPGDEA